MDALEIRSIMLANPSHGPDTDQVLCAAVDQLDEAERPAFAQLFGQALKSLLGDTDLAPLARETGLDCATHVLNHLRSQGLMEPIQEGLLTHSLAWIKAHPNKNETTEHWHMRGSVLRLLRLLGHQEELFWREEFKFWVQQLEAQPEQFVAISRALMQSVRVLGPMGVLESRDFGAMFAAGLRGGHFPVHEVYAALEEVSKWEKLDGPNVAKNLLNAIRLAAKDASSPGIGLPINEANRQQMGRTLQSWIKNCLGLNDVWSLPANPRPVAGFPAEGVPGFYDKAVEL